jgi:hypothetical protein
MTTTPGAVSAFALARYAVNSSTGTATNKGIVAQTAANYSTAVDGTTRRSLNSIKSKVAAITVSQ